MRQWSIDEAFHQASLLGGKGWEYRDFPRWIRWRIRLWNFTEKIRYPIFAFRAWRTRRQLKKLFPNDVAKEIERIIKKSRR